jgi:hypothetical protein
MANTCTFVKDAVTVTLPPPGAVIQGACHIPSNGIQTGDGWFGYSFGTKWYEYTLEFNALTQSTLNALQDFYTDTVKGAANEWTFTRVSGATHTVRFLREPDFEQVSESGNGLHSLSVQIRSATRITA